MSCKCTDIFWRLGRWGGKCVACVKGKWTSCSVKHWVIKLTVIYLYAGKLSEGTINTLIDRMKNEGSKFAGLPAESAIGMKQKVNG